MASVVDKEIDRLGQVMHSCQTRIRDIRAQYNDAIRKAQKQQPQTSATTKLVQDLEIRKKALLDAETLKNRECIRQRNILINTPVKKTTPPPPPPPLVKKPTPPVVKAVPLPPVVQPPPPQHSNLQTLLSRSQTIEAKILQLKSERKKIPSKSPSDTDEKKAMLKSKRKAVSKQLRNHRADLRDLTVQIEKLKSTTIVQSPVAAAKPAPAPATALKHMPTLPPAKPAAAAVVTVAKPIPTLPPSKPAAAAAAVTVVAPLPLTTQLQKVNNEMRNIYQQIRTAQLASANAIAQLKTNLANVPQSDPNRNKLRRDLEERIRVIRRDTQDQLSKLYDEKNYLKKTKAILKRGPSSVGGSTPTSVPLAPYRPSQKQIDYINCIGKNAGQIIDLILLCQPKRIGFLSHYLVPFSYKDERTHGEYIQDMVPLMFEELRTQITQECEENGVEIRDNGEMDYIRIKTMPISIDILAETRDNVEGVCLKFCQRLNDPDQALFQSDLMLLVIKEGVKRPVHVFGLVDSAVTDRKNPSLKRYSIRILEDQTNYPHTTEFIDALYDIKKSKGKVHIARISNLTTFQREYNAIQRFISHSLGPLILTPEQYLENKKPSPSYAIPKRLQDKLPLNPSQMIAIKQCMIQDELTLIQGPPGTGKTTTILSLLGIYHSILPPQCQILVCAPSNTAVDEIGIRFLRDGLVSEEEENERPGAVRLGSRLEVINEKLHPICTSRIDDLKRRIMMIRSARIVLSTLSGSASTMLAKAGCRPSIIIVDESTQSCEPSTLIPLLRNFRSKVILIGDPKQLPPTVFSDISSRFNYDVSLFERLSNYLPVHMLDTQYRMHPSISKFPSDQFYQAKLKDGENVVKYSNSFYNDKKYGPINFYHIPDSQEDTTIGKSIKNNLEIKLVYVLLKKLVQEYPEVKKMSVGIITPYKLQKKELLEAKGAFNEKMDVVVNTVDGFQGAEKDIIIFSCVRNKKIGFLRDTRRINVGITRARRAIYVVGYSSLLEQDPNWGAYLRFIKDRIGKYVTIDSKGIEVLQEQVRQHDLRHPEGLIVATKEEFEEIKEFYDSNDDRIFHDISDGEDDHDDDEDDEDEKDEEDQQQTTIQESSLFASLLSSFKSLTLFASNSDDDNSISTRNAEMVKVVEENLIKYHGLQDIRLTPETKLQLKETRRNIWKKLRELIKKQNLDTTKTNSTFNPFLGVEDHRHMNHYLVMLCHEKRCKNVFVKNTSWMALQLYCAASFPECNVKPYGSFVNGIQLESSDLDVCFSTREDMKTAQELLFVLKDSKHFKLEKIIQFSRVPILKFTDTLHNISYDMCFNNRLAIGNSLLIQSYANMDPRAKQLMLLVKYWSSQKDINDASVGTLSSYSWLNMVVFYLQTIQPPVLPSLQQIDSSTPPNRLVRSVVDGWKFLDPKMTGFDSKNTMTVFQLLYGFFSFYSKFNFSNLLISIRLGKPTNIRMASKEYLDHHHKRHICIEDPFETSHNPAASVGRVAFDVIVYEIIAMETRLKSMLGRTPIKIEYDHLFSQSSLMKFCSNNKK
ncbi:Regulator of nonsense transcripts [Cavenderia fasciculata]|uniref:Regulator of nonsense transcripts n=1 Tax=Cavenderia fasciculata TaxID=261658 RepID=F4PX58_CACFS|nr:Regulator of nonsense transcripts [Cavenderia fasciculata]EGG19861.1 Regulator of nonsense transcripts [Cavenderia fasciculata]|eukprot:XP_004358207.1 Regulator of nonsense transcripts [Cavenderia fasciculata]